MNYFDQQMLVVYFSEYAFFSLFYGRLQEQDHVAQLGASDYGIYLFI